MPIIILSGDIYIGVTSLEQTFYFTITSNLNYIQLKMKGINLSLPKEGKIKKNVAEKIGCSKLKSLAEAYQLLDSTEIFSI